MKIKKVKQAYMFFVSLGLVLIGFACEKNDLPPLDDRVLSVLEIQASDCKENLKSITVEQSVKLKAVNSTQLQLEFINGSLNCCPGEIQSSAYIEDQILRVNFHEEIPGICNCTCYYDLGCLIDSLENRRYTMEIYIGGDKLDASFSFEYSKNLEQTIKIN